MAPPEMAGVAPSVKTELLKNAVSPMYVKHEEKTAPPLARGAQVEEWGVVQ